MNKETFEEAAEKYGKEVGDKYKNRIDLTHDEQIYLVGGNIVGFKEGVKWEREQNKNKYSEEEVYELCKESRNEGYDENTLEQIGGNEKIVPFDEWFEQNRKK
jgi:hypothetical protein